MLLHISRRRRSAHRGFTLIELIIVVAIVAIMMAVLLGVVLDAFSKGDETKTKEVFLEISKAIQIWRDKEGKAPGAFPRTGKNTLEDKYAGNMKLFRALVTRPQSKGKDPYIDVDDEMIGYLGKDGSISETGPESRALFLDAWGSPIVYWEWKSRTDDVMDPDDPTGTRTTRLITKKEKKLAKKGGQLGSYDLYSAGEDGQLGTSDDLDKAGSTVPKSNSPFFEG